MDDFDLDFDQLTEVLKKGAEKVERRKKKDWVKQMAPILSLSAWALVIAVWVIIEAAAPERERRFITSFFDVTFGTAPSIREKWDYTLVYVAYILFLVSIGICAIAFVFNRFRMRRETDKINKSIIVIGCITIVSFVFFIIRFGYVLF